MVRRDPTRRGVGPDAVATALLGGLYVILLAGKFSAGALDVRAVGAVLVAVAAVAMSHQPVRSPGSSSLVVALTLLCTYMGLTGFWAPTGARVQSVVGDLTSLVIFVAAASYFLRRCSTRVLDRFWWLIFATGMVYGLGALAQGSVTSQGRLSAFGGGPNVFVRIVCLGVLAAAFLALTRPRGRLAAVGVPVLLMCAILSGSRGGLVALIVAGFAVGLLAISGRSQRIRRWTIGSTVALIVVSYFVIWPRVRAFVQTRFIDETFNQGYTSGRSDISAQSTEIFKAHPLTGAGIDGYWALIGHTEGYQYPHNILLTAATEGGVIGLCLLLATLFIGFRGAFKKSAPLATNMAALAALYILTASMFSGYWYDTRFLWVFLILGIEYHSRHRDVEPVKPKPRRRRPSSSARPTPPADPTSVSTTATQSRRARLQPPARAQRTASRRRGSRGHQATHRRRRTRR